MEARNGRAIAVTMGDPAGIGPEVIVKSWLRRHVDAIPPFFVIGDLKAIEQAALNLGQEVAIEQCEAGGATSVFETSLPILKDMPLTRGQAGKPDIGDGEAICSYIKRAVQAVSQNDASAIVTAPINKHALYQAGFDYPGHTEFLAALAADYFNMTAQPVMMLVGPELRSVPVTIHIALREIVSKLSSELILSTIRIVHLDLVKRFNIPSPRIAVSGLNPHAGEGGSMGKEDGTIIAPAIKAAQKEGINAFGPLPADTMFHSHARKQHDVAVCMYHDQALIPAKTLAFDEAVNVTLGLPFIRTSPDHGTALDIAGKGIAKASSMIAAIKLANAMVSKSQSDEGGEN